MKCPECGAALLKEERLSPDGTATYLAHICIKCFKRFTLCPECQEEMMVTTLEDEETLVWICECGHEEKVK